MEPSKKLKIECPYIGTVQRHMLDFDQLKQCCITLATTSIYCCLVCGKYFHGRGSTTPAYTHALDVQHFLYINCHSLKIYCLPDNYVVNDGSLDDIKHNLLPSYNESSLIDLNSVKYGRALDATEYIVGCMGLNNLKATDYINASVQILARIPELRDFLLLNEMANTHLAKEIGLVFRRMWNGNSFKASISPHSLVKEITELSKGKFKVRERSDAQIFLTWVLNVLSNELIDYKIISKFITGKLQDHETGKTIPFLYVRFI